MKTQEEMIETGKHFLSDEEFNEMLSEEMEMMKKLFDGDPERNSLTPQLVIVGPKDKDGKRKRVMIVLAGLGGEEFQNNKYKLLFSVGVKIAKDNDIVPNVAFLFSEAWVRTFANGEKHTKKQIADYADKKEAIIITGLVMDTRCNLGTWYMERDKENHVKLTEKQLQPYDGKVKAQSDLLSRFFQGYAIATVQPERLEEFKDSIFPFTEMKFSDTKKNETN